MYHFRKRVARLSKDSVQFKKKRQTISNFAGASTAHAMTLIIMKTAAQFK